jgi:hypothetical protein
MTRQSGWHDRFRVVAVGILAGLAAFLSGCGGDDNNDQGASAPTFNATKAKCGASDKPEADLQGQVSAATRAAGFKGYNCNLQLIGQYRGEGASWQHAWFADKAGHLCNYYDTSASTDNRQHLGVVVIDATVPTAPQPTAYLTSVAMLDPWESLKVNERRQLLGGTQATGGSGGPGLDLYDIGGDCRNPQLLSSVNIGTVANGDADALPPGYNLVGHEGNFSPDGLTWYNGDRGTVKKYTAIDITNATHPKLLTTWDIPLIPTTTLTTHGLSLNEAGTRGYFSRAGVLGANVDLKTAPEADGMFIVDTTEVAQRVPNPKMKLISTVTWRDAGQMQHTIPINVNGKNYVLAVGESGTGGNSAAGYTASCAANLPPFQSPRIIDISDETKPVVVSRLYLEIHDPKNCDKVLPDTAGLSSFIYGSHYCSVDNKKNTTTVACGYFESGIRVFDVRDVAHPKEIAYFNPPAVTTPSPGSQNNRTAATGRPDHCSAQIRLDAATASLQTTCQDNGFLSLKFTNGVWPFPETTTPPGQQNG